jgi:hypothetical protein
MLPRTTGRHDQAPRRRLVFSGAWTLLVLPTAARAETFADSEADWSVSGTQGERGWCGGYYNFTFDGGTYAPEDFIPFSEEHWDGASSTWRLGPDNGSPWTLLGRTQTHPNAPTESPYEEHWTVRRWASDHDGEVAITWQVRKTDTRGGNGVTGHLYLNGEEIGSLTVAGNDGIGVTRTQVARIVPGDFIDLALDPSGADGVHHEAFDGSATRLVVSTPQRFVRGDLEGNGTVGPFDLVPLLRAMAGEELRSFRCDGSPDSDSADANDNEHLTVADFAALSAALFCGHRLPVPENEGCGVDPTGERGAFPASEAEYGVGASVVPRGDEVQVVLRVTSPTPVRALSVIVRYGQELRPLDPFVTLSGSAPGRPLFTGPLDLGGGHVAVHVMSTEACSNLSAGGENREVAVLHFAVADCACPILELLPRFDRGASTFFSTVVDDAYQDHAPRLSAVPAPCFLRGDAQRSGVVDAADRDAVLGHLHDYQGGDFRDCFRRFDSDSADANDNEHLTIADAMRISAHVECGELMPCPESCALDFTGPGVFPATEAAYRVEGTLVSGGPRTELVVRLDTPKPLKGVSAALGWGPGVTPADPVFVLNPLLNADFRVIVEESRLLLVVEQNQGCGRILMPPGLDQVLGSFWFETELPGHCPLFNWLPEADVGGPAQFATLVDNEFADHHPEFALETLIPRFIRADANVTGDVDLSDVIKTLNHLFQGEPVDCELALDSNDDEWKDISDAIYTLGFLFLGGPPPPPPFPGCGCDITPSPLLSCVSFEICGEYVTPR